MRRVSSAEFVRQFSLYTDAALSEPVVLTRNGRDRLVVASIDDFREILSLAVLNASDDTQLAALAKALQAISDAPVSPASSRPAKKRATRAR